MKRGQPRFVKALSVTGSKMSLSMRDADQKTGADLNPLMRLPDQALQPLHEELPRRICVKTAEAGADEPDRRRSMTVRLLASQCDVLRSLEGRRLPSPSPPPQPQP